MQEVAKNIFVETEYDDVNVCAILTPAGIICIDVPTYARDARDWAARLHRLSPTSAANHFDEQHGDRVLNTVGSMRPSFCSNRQPIACTPSIKSTCNR